MKRLIWLFILIGTAFAATVNCPIHPYGSCYGTGQYKYINGQPWEQYNCSCGDSYWVKQ